jgi:hypothetical protein
VITVLRTAAAVLAVGVFFAVAVVGMVGLTRATYRAATRRAWPTALVTASTVLGGLLAFIGGWLFYLLWWPWTRVFKRHQRLHLVGPVLGSLVLLVTFGLVVDRLAPTVHPLVINDARQSAQVSGCTDDPALLKAGERSSGPFFAKNAHWCTVLLGPTYTSGGCISLPHPLNDYSVIRVSASSPFPTRTGDCPN